MALVAGVLGRAGEKGRKRRLEEASKGLVPWETSPDLRKHMTKEVQAAMLKQKEVMGRIQSQVKGFTDEEKDMLRRHYDAAAPDFDEAKMMDVLGKTAAGEEGKAEAEAGEVTAAAGRGQEAGEAPATTEAEVKAEERPGEKETAVTAEADVRADVQPGEKETVATAEAEVKADSQPEEKETAATTEAEAKADSQLGDKETASVDKVKEN